MAGDTQLLRAPGPRVSWLRPVRGWWLWVGAAAAVLAGLAVAVAVLVAPSASVVTAGAADGAPLTGEQSVRTALEQAIETGSALAASTTANDLADPAAYTALMGALVMARLALDGTPQEAEAARLATVSSIDRVTRSQRAKALGDAQAGLAAVIGTAQELLVSSEGRVADDAVRVELQVRVDAGRLLLASATGDIEQVAAQTQAITDQTAAVLAARLLGFLAAEGEWCRGDGRSCVAITWPMAAFAGGTSIELSGGDEALEGSGCFETEPFGSGRDQTALLYCPAGEVVPEGRRVAGGDTGDASRDRLWTSSGGRLSDLRYRA